ncbi:hypothetical protein H8356DRAFT_1428774 [Neocallimastix lanati (nom. inval.)]|nr:hypothetical protein H8356DRAFT_1428774 [Neocallimastix sp. JGI-2020a]
MIWNKNLSCFPFHNDYDFYTFVPGSILAVKALVFPSAITDKYIGLSMMDLKNGTNLSRYISYIQIVNNMISAIPDDRGVGGMTVSLDFQVVERRRQNDKACKDLFIKIHSCDLPMM